MARDNRSAVVLFAGLLTLGGCSFSASAGSTADGAASPSAASSGSSRTEKPDDGSRSVGSALSAPSANDGGGSTPPGSGQVAAADPKAASEDTDPGRTKGRSRGASGKAKSDQGQADEAKSDPAKSSQGKKRRCNNPGKKKGHDKGKARGEAKGHDMCDD